MRNNMTRVIGRSLGQYEIVGVLGRGGMATVYSARQTSMNREVALKVVDADQTGTADIVRRFKREVQINAMLSHPHILKVFDYGQQDSLIYLVMEYIAGGSLNNVIYQQPLAVETASALLDQLASAIDYTHELGIIHRDIKPQNILVDNRGNAFLSDFGIAVVLTDTTDRQPPGVVIGTPGYMAPEDRQGLPPTAQSDIYSLGVVLFEMLAGKRMFSAINYSENFDQSMMETLPSVLALRPELPIEIRDILTTALATDPRGRYRSAGLLASAFKRVLPTSDLTPIVPVLPWLNATPQSVSVTTPLEVSTSVPTSSSPAIQQAYNPHATPPSVRRVAVSIIALLIGIAAIGFLNTRRTSSGTATVQSAGRTAATSTLGLPIAPSRVLTVNAPQSSPLSMLHTQTVEPTSTTASALKTTLLALPSATILPLTLSTVVTTPPIVTDNYQLAFTSDRNMGINAIFLSNGDGSNLRELTANTSNNYGPVWSPDGQFIAFTSYRDGNAEVYIMDSHGGHQRNLTHSSFEDFDPSWSPDGHSLAFVSNRSGNRDIYRMEVDGSNVRNLTNNPAMDWFPSWSPDGTHLAFTSNRDDNFDIYVMDFDGSNVRNLTNNPADDRFASWSPDGASIVFNTNRDGNFEVYVMDAYGRNAHNLTNHPADDRFGSWTPDSRTLAFATNRDGSQAIYIMDVDGHNPRRLTDDPHNNFYPAWRPLP